MSSSTARAPARSRFAAERWTSTMVGLVSPEPMSTSNPGMLSASLFTPHRPSISAI
ncbi:hypothetical protein [Nonomuraea guangzhouensis]|uniref:Uncharacterized protein n=1 Tax=Nonomuraea guangzhouensis TaxID=1291555 RepID=A0ABW4GAP8_9ACTN